LRTDILEPEELKLERCKPYSDFGSSQTFASTNTSGMHSANFWCGEEFFRLTHSLRVQKSVKYRNVCLRSEGHLAENQRSSATVILVDIRHVEPTSQHTTVLYVQIQMTVCYELTLFGFVLNRFLCNVEYKFVSILILSL